MCGENILCGLRDFRKIEVKIENWIYLDILLNRNIHNRKISNRRLIQVVLAIVKGQSRMKLYFVWIQYIYWEALKIKEKKRQAPTRYATLPWGKG